MRNSSAGFSLIELMIALVIVGVVFVGVGSMFQTQMATSIGNKDETELQTSTQATLNMIAADIISAGLGLPDTPFDVVNVSGTATGGDTLTIRSTFSNGRGMNSFLFTGSAGYSGTAPIIRCWGQDGNGHGYRNPLRDFNLVPGFQTYALFVSPFDAHILTGVGANPVAVTALNAGAGFVDKCNTDGSIASGTKLYGTAVENPVLELTTAATVGPLQQGTIIYGYLCPPCDASNLPITTYALDTSTATLLQNGTPVLAGVEDFQVRFYSDPVNGPAPCGTVAGCDSLTGLTGDQMRKLNRIELGMVVRTVHTDAHLQSDPRTSIVTLGHTLTLSPAMQRYPRKQIAYQVRPKNNAEYQ